ncbi:hypothetical protein FBY06_105233 [Pseudomonas sp. SJZ085]|nr:hypothetical protein FBY00_102104 [Pseudomonas sp. SJZ075]TWC22547.1 hypothetical protein FBX99_10580 [Pseudomonas sp. SJZ074]TWC37313.1 hypothetical protein FBY02_102104 [Pseudomonas sp. SJZ078]TWC39929.1 hypothetical protein FBY06_105233 [Pseudomonas sp. SJZ085]TWC58086.1 hypothetical protein FBY11_102239 [Pseudomonas sp. SJZ124]TWC93708.1 hypothetical protein FBY09_102104 [Pseudomonas sp. SJZ101]
MGNVGHLRDCLHHRGDYFISISIVALKLLFYHTGLSLTEIFSLLHHCQSSS